MRSNKFLFPTIIKKELQSKPLKQLGLQIERAVTYPIIKAATYSMPVLRCSRLVSKEGTVTKNHHN